MKTTKTILNLYLPAMLLLFALTACGNTAAATSEPKLMGKVVVNIEGYVTAINGDAFTLDSGKVVLISDDTVFAGDADTNNAVNRDILLGNFIQGYTADDPESDRVTAGKIYSNFAMQTDGNAADQL